MGFRRSRGSAKERDAPQTIYCTAVCLTSTRASECVAGDLDLRSLKSPYIALPAESTPEEIAAIGIIVAVLNQLLIRSGREDQAMMTTLAGLVVVLSILVKQISALFVTIKSLFAL